MAVALAAGLAVGAGTLPQPDAASHVRALAELPAVTAEVTATRAAFPLAGLVPGAFADWDAGSAN
jgi:hypothetical protein